MIKPDPRRTVSYRRFLSGRLVSVRRWVGLESELMERRLMRLRFHRRLRCFRPNYKASVFRKWIALRGHRGRRLDGN